MNELYKAYRDEVEFFVVYIKEAHAADSDWPMAVPGETINTPKTWGERSGIAKKCMTKLKIEIPCLIDNLEDSVDAAYAGWPDRLFVVDKAGKIVVRGKRGPWGFKPSVSQAKIWLAEKFPQAKVPNG